MRVAVLGQYPLRPDHLIGGVEATIVYQQRELLRVADLDLRIVTCNEGLHAPRTVEHAGGMVTYLPRHRLGRATWHLREVRAMRAALHDLQPDLVHAHGAGLYGGAALASPFPTVVTAHGIFALEARFLRGRRNRLRGVLDSAYERWVIRRTKHLIVISPYVREVFARDLRAQTYLVENPCDERFFDLKRRPVPGRILLAGVVIPRKGVLPLLQAIRLLRERLPGVHLRVAGSTSSRADYASQCHAYVRETGLGDGVSFLGHLDQAQVLEEYATCSALALPSFQETAPVALVQGMAAGIPVVATAVGGVPHLIDDGATGWLVTPWTAPTGDPIALALKLEQALQSDPAGAIGLRAKRIALDRFHPEIVARRVYEVYRRVLGLSAGPAATGEPAL